VLKKSGKRVFEPLEEKLSSKIRSGSFVKFEKIPDILGIVAKYFESLQLIDC